MPYVTILHPIEGIQGGKQRKRLFYYAEFAFLGELPTLPLMFFLVTVL